MTSVAMTSDKVPQPIEKARKKLADLGLPVTKENIEKHIEPSEINKLLGVMRNTLARPGNEKQKSSYSNAIAKRLFSPRTYWTQMWPLARC